MFYKSPFSGFFFNQTYFKKNNYAHTRYLLVDFNLFLANSFNKDCLKENVTFNRLSKNGDWDIIFGSKMSRITSLKLIFFYIKLPGRKKEDYSAHRAYSNVQYVQMTYHISTRNMWRSSISKSLNVVCRGYSLMFDKVYTIQLCRFILGV